jgi:hypothetical protein
MLARLTNKTLLTVLIAGMAVSVVAFTAFHRGTGIISQRTFDSAEGVPLASRLGSMPTPMPMSLGRVSAAYQAAVAGAGPVGEPIPVTAVAKARFMPPPPRGTRGPSQLIRTANLSIEVADVSRALRAATTITEGELGDVIGLNDETPTSENAIHTGTMSIRVPQYRFEQTLDALSGLGKVKSKSVNAQDVSDQLIDSQARLRNLRRTEADILNIMDRSGNIEQVLNVTQQLGSVREQIEQLDAQIKGMQYQVAYSTINITFASPVVVSTPSGFGLLGTAWQNALNSLRDFTVSLLSLGLWLVAFSPYIIVIALIVALAMHRIRSHALPTRTN